MKHVGFILSLGLFLLILNTPASSTARELPILVKLSEIDASFHKKRVTVFGWVRSAEVKTGRRGSLHLELLVGKGDETIMVFIIRPVYNVVGNEVIIQGIYHQHGRFAGFEQQHFIVADAIVRNWPEKSKAQNEQKEEENQR